MLRQIAFIAIAFASVSSLALDNAYFQSPNRPNVVGECVQLKKSGASYLWHCVVRPAAPGKAAGKAKKNIEDFSAAEKASAGYRGSVEADVSAAYKTGGSVGHMFAGVAAYATAADKTAKKPKK